MLKLFAFNKLAHIEDSTNIELNLEIFFNSSTFMDFWNGYICKAIATCLNKFMFLLYEDMF